MSLSHERAIDLSRRILDGLRKAPGVELTAEAEYVTKGISSALQGLSLIHISEPTRPY